MPRRARGSGTAASAASTPAANSGGPSPVGAVDNEAFSDDGDAGLTHFGNDQQGVGTSMIF
jgi:hypothetical protein